MTGRLASWISAAAFVMAAAASGGDCRAHFPWLATDAEGHALLYFGESPDDRAYHTPDAVAAAKVLLRQRDGQPQEISLAAVETDDFIGRRSETTVPLGSVLAAEIHYGNYHGALLDYYAKHLTSIEAASVPSGLKLDIVPKFTEANLEVVVHWDGTPLAKAAVTLFDAEGARTEAETNESGVATFAAPEPGPLGILVVRTDNEATGEFKGEEYTSAMACATVTMDLKEARLRAIREAADAERDAASESTDATSALAPLPEPVASFGAAVSDGWLYVYGGHTGEEHAHSRDNLSNHFRRIAIAGGASSAQRAWEELPMELALQGLPLVAHGGKIYRVGGLTFRNAAADEPDMHSVAEFACFDPKSNEWTALTPLPEARSSHDAVMIGDVLYVVGGWTLSGGSEGEWLSTAWSYDLSDSQAEWQALASPPFKRRALAAARWNRQIVAIGGMDDDAKVSRRVDALDPATGAWSRLPDLPRSQMAGFGVSAWNLDGKLLVSGADGVVLQLADDGATWDSVGKLATGRFFHRLMPGVGTSLLAIAGASAESGKHLATIESFSPGAKN